MEREILVDAIRIASRADDNHPFAVAEEVVKDRDYDWDYYYVVGLLHDSIEDGYATVMELLDTFPLVIAESVSTLTRIETEPYWEYINRVKEGNEYALAVKIADAKVNLERCFLSENFSLGSRYEKVLEVLGE